VSDWGWVAFGYTVVYLTLFAYVGWSIYQYRVLSQKALEPAGDKPLAGADITAPQLGHLGEEQYDAL
jgi:hypothetical protein